MFKTNYKDARMILTEAVLVSFFVDFDKFLFPGVFSESNFISMFRNFRGHGAVPSRSSRPEVFCKKRYS